MTGSLDSGASRAARPVEPMEDGCAEDVNDDGPGVLDLVLSVLLGAATVVLMSVWAYPFMHPSAWMDTAAGAGSMPPAHVFPGSVRVAASLAYLALPAKAAIPFLAVVARVIAGATVAFTYFLFSDILYIMLRNARSNPIWGKRIKRLTVFLAASLFACSDALWSAGQTLSADTFLLFGTVFMLWLFFRFLCSGRLSYFYFCVFAAGMMCAESPAGLFWAVFLTVASIVALRRLGDVNLPFLDPLVMQFSKWRMSFFIFQGFALGLTLNLASFFILHGWKASGWKVSDLIIKSVVRYGVTVTESADILGLLLFLLFAVLPVIVAVLLFRGATDEDGFLPYRSGLAFVIIGFTAYSQLCALKPLWFWTWSGSGQLIPSLYVRGVSSLASSFSLLLALVVLGVAVYVRNNHRIMRQRFPEFLESAAEAARIAANRRAVRVVRRFGAVLMFALLLAGALPGRRQETMRGVLGAIRDFVRETVAEAGDSAWLFTDGHFDAAVELCAAEEGRALRTVSMLSGHGAYDKYIRTRGVEASDEENYRILENGTMDALRTWICERPEGAVKFAAQIGFEFWKRAGRPFPPVAGVLLRPGMGAEEAEVSSARARAIAERVLALRGDGFEKSFYDPVLAGLADAVLWRVSHLSRVKANVLDIEGKAREANERMKFSERLDRSNESLGKLIERVNRKARETGPQLTPREGLKLALNRADFSLAARYAIPVLNADPGDPEANFGMGMNFLVEKQYTRAAEHLRRVLERRPKEAAAYNNLAVCLVNMNDFSGAEKMAGEALKLMPKSPEIKETLELIAKAKAEAAKRTLPGSLKTKENKK